VRAFGVSQELDGMADSPVRSAFVVDAGGVIRFAKRYGDDQVPNADELLAACRDVTNSA
jgi:peroxiredoxin